MSVRVVVVLAMHRSGTSAVARVLARAGAQVPGEMSPVQSDNPRGYWEPRHVVETHDRFLRAVGRTWSDPRPMHPDLFAGTAAARARPELERFLSLAMEGRSPVTIKDPRMCRLMPLWPDKLAGPDVHFVHLVRSPIAVAESLQARDAFPRQKSLLLWLRHHLEAERSTRGCSRTFVRFEDFAASPASLLEALGLASLTPDARPPGLETELIHHSFDDHETLAELEPFPWVRRTFRWLAARASSTKESDFEALDSIAAELGYADALLLGEPAGWEAAIHAERYAWLHKTSEECLRLLQARTQDVTSVLHASSLHASQSLTPLDFALDSGPAAESGEEAEKGFSASGRLLARSLATTARAHDALAAERRLRERAEVEVRRLQEGARLAENRAAHERSKIADLESLLAERGADARRQLVLGGDALRRERDLEQDLLRERTRTAQLRVALRQIEASRSWRITRPLRSLLAWLRARRAAGK